MFFDFSVSLAVLSSIIHLSRQDSDSAKKDCTSISFAAEMSIPFFILVRICCPPPTLLRHSLEWGRCFWFGMGGDGNIGIFWHFFSLCAYLLSLGGFWVHGLVMGYEYEEDGGGRTGGFFFASK
ncbi:hypothetical protein CC86DRAFT_4977 [Ophiobolus disseminans]|uniref:Uncharacterized protein n=1 Tax=Ophiobolus disseminans TaxID=1469910 RepID=A0A6A7AKA4_9PLEO|nr:hypothetical protein CC86DRAFT_4977 [Ophiobolus disseminans]